MSMLPAIEAEAKILDLVNPLADTETVNLETASGRILASAIAGNLDIPHWDNSAMDGYAVRYQDVVNCDSPKILEVIEEIPAGYTPKKTIQAGQSARIFTGAMLPAGADTIVIQENTEREGNKVKVLTAPQSKQFVRHRGAFYSAGKPLLSPGIKIDAADIAVLATAQCTEIPVYRRPRVAILSTGNELVTPEQTLQPGQIVDSNQYALASFISENGGIPLRLGIVPDDRDTLKDTIKKAIASADFVLSTGGVSVGDYDYVDKILAELGGELHIRSVAIKPGKPLTVATFPNSCLYFGIPGNPVSALVSCWRFVLPALKKLSGQQDYKPIFIKARTRDRLKSGGRRETYLWGRLQIVDGEYEFALAGGSHSSGNLINLSQTNGLAIIPIGETAVTPGSNIKVMQV